MPATISAETVPTVSVIHQTRTNWVSADPMSESAWPVKTHQ
jgi:hypothetical protein